MPLDLLLVLVIGGIAAIALVLHLSGHSQVAPLTKETARAGWLRHFPGSPPLEVRLSADGRAALVQTERMAGVVWQIGADTIARPLGDHRLSETAAGLVLRFDDFGAPRLSLTLDEAERAEWKRALT
jgi:hypothetical protein